MYVCIEIVFKKLALMIVEADKSKICRVGWQAGDPGKRYNFSLLEEFLLWGDHS
jgi:hypothetical protein